MKRIITTVIAITLSLTACSLEVQGAEVKPTPPARDTISSVSSEFIYNLEGLDRSLASSAETALTGYEIEELIDGICDLAVLSYSGDGFAEAMVIVADSAGFTDDEMASVAVSALLSGCPDEAHRLLG